MKLTVYRRDDGTFLIIPTGSHVLQSVQRSHGPLTLCTHVRAGEIEDPLVKARLAIDISARAFAVIDGGVAQILMGLTCDELRTDLEQRARHDITRARQALEAGV